jgi:regulator of nucleoside diphosphate kinase
MTHIDADSHYEPGLEPPTIKMAEDELRRLTTLADSCMKRFPRVAQFLSEEMERATVVADARDLQGVVRMGSKVIYRDDETGVVRETLLVYPHEADIAFNRVSILTPVGAALIGLSAGQRIEVQTPGSGIRSITVLGVSEA